MHPKTQRHPEINPEIFRHTIAAIFSRISFVFLSRPSQVPWAFARRRQQQLHRGPLGSLAARQAEVCAAWRWEPVEMVKLNKTTYPKLKLWKKKLKKTGEPCQWHPMAILKASDNSEETGLFWVKYLLHVWCLMVFELQLGSERFRSEGSVHETLGSERFREVPKWRFHSWNVRFREVPKWRFHSWNVRFREVPKFHSWNVRFREVPKWRFRSWNVRLREVPKWRFHSWNVRFREVPKFHSWNVRFREVPKWRFYSWNVRFREVPKWRFHSWNVRFREVPKWRFHSWNVRFREVPKWRFHSWNVRFREVPKWRFHSWNVRFREVPKWRFHSWNVRCREVPKWRFHSWNVRFREVPKWRFHSGKTSHQRGKTSCVYQLFGFHMGHGLICLFVGWLVCWLVAWLVVCLLNSDLRHRTLGGDLKAARCCAWAVPKACAGDEGPVSGRRA